MADQHDCTNLLCPTGAYIRVTTLTALQGIENQIKSGSRNFQTGLAGRSNDMETRDVTLIFYTDCSKLYHPREYLQPMCKHFLSLSRNSEWVGHIKGLRLSPARCVKPLDNWAKRPDISTSHCITQLKTILGLLEKMDCLSQVYQAG